MNKRMRNKQWKKQMVDTVHACQKRLCVGIERHLRMPIGYYPATDKHPAKLVTNPERFVQLYHSDYEHIGCIEDVLRAFVLHELGHHLDDTLAKKVAERWVHHHTWRDLDVPKGFRKNPIGLALQNRQCLPHLILENEAIVSYETTAWEIAKDLNNRHLFVSPIILQQVKKEALSTYQEPLDDALHAYKQLKQAN